MSVEKIAKAIRDIPDFPKPGIIFKDITPLLQDPELFAEIIDNIAARYSEKKPDRIVGVEARGFIFGAALAYKLGCSFVPVRKAGKLPYKTIKASYELEYGKATVEIHEDALNAGDTVLLIDDLLATGGTVSAAADLIKRLDANIIGIEFVIELGFLNGREKLGDLPVNSMIIVD